MKQKFLLIFSVLSLGAWAQVGINTDSPQATLHIATPATPTTTNNGGLVLENPGMEKTQIPTFDIAGGIDLFNQNILVQQGNGVPKRVNHLKRWFTTYQPIRPSDYVIGNNSATVQDHTILVHADMTLPLSTNMRGKVIHLVYSNSTGTPFTISGAGTNKIQWNGQLLQSVVIDRQNPTYVMHFDGNEWIIIDGYQVATENLETNGITAAYDIAENGDFTFTEDHYTVRVYGNAGNLILPNAADVPGKIYTIIGSNGSGTHTFNFSGGNSIYDDVTNSTITQINQNERITIQSDGNGWIVIGR